MCSSLCTDVLHIGGPRRASRTLQQLPVKIISDEVCGRDDWLGQHFNATVMLCAGIAAGGSGPCTGDSGGPLQCQSHDGIWKLTGIASFSHYDGCTLPKKPIVYTRVQAILGWIDYIVNYSHRGTVPLCPTRQPYE